MCEIYFNYKKCEQLLLNNVIYNNFQAAIMLNFHITILHIFKYYYDKIIIDLDYLKLIYNKILKKKLDYITSRKFENIIKYLKLNLKKFCLILKNELEYHDFEYMYINNFIIVINKIIEIDLINLIQKNQISSILKTLNINLDYNKNKIFFIVTSGCKINTISIDIDINNFNNIINSFIVNYINCNLFDKINYYTFLENIIFLQLVNIKINDFDI